MNLILAALHREPVRARLYTLASVVAGYALAKGYVDVTDSGFIVAVAGLVLGVESSRAKVSPVTSDDEGGL